MHFTLEKKQHKGSVVTMQKQHIGIADLRYYVGSIVMNKSN
jgi:hypothetical protein